jgi:hypothetical protein
LLVARFDNLGAQAAVQTHLMLGVEELTGLTT